ncbi:LOW QUALITY PROTEIN: LRR_6 domain-containing protein [Cephalotus follicularis]|uniref:LRR_6 domain-containing protein n=1 Tax=Cephalotus follicularis TaxID=3775 RepID=A0A1Q3CV30_CEPFO|nr:LOW QUALITY PROTEIN: LRR_6 domain-containing protein [Cephalotus follicularis]
MPSKSLLSVLTDDLLTRILDKLITESDRKTSRLVCKDFYRVDSLTRKTLRVLRVEFLVTLLQKHTHLHTLDLSVCPRIDDATISLILPRPGGDSLSLCWTRGLKTLILSRASGLRHLGLEMLTRACPCLERIDVSYCCGFGDREAFAISYALGLRELKVDKCLGVSDVGLAKIAVGCSKLERLSLKWCKEISDMGVDLLCKKCTDLRALDLSYLKVTNKSLYSVALLPKLESLAMVGCPLVDDVGLRFLENGCPLLQEIDVSRCECISSCGLVSVIRGHNYISSKFEFGKQELSLSLLNCLKDVKNLKTIVVDGARISNFSFETISTTCKSLIEIGLSKCVGVTNMGIMQLVSGCSNLKILNLTCCRFITDAAISAIADCCRNLACLKLEACTMITDKGLFQLGSFCLQLKDLDLTDCCGVNDRGLEYVSRCSELLCLKLGLCTNISDKGLSYIASNCTKISELDLYRCTGIGDGGLAALSSGCKKLKNLNLSYCIRLTDRGMEYIGSLEELSDLELRGLLNITGVGLAAVAAGCKRLSDLDLKHCEKIDDTGFWALAYYQLNLRQINLSYCAISEMALCMVMGNLKCLQDAKLVHLANVTVDGFELALRVCCVRIKKVKLQAPLSFLLSSEVLETLHARGCKIRWD